MKKKYYILVGFVIFILKEFFGMSCFDFKNNKRNFGNSKFDRSLNMGDDATAPNVAEYDAFKKQINYMMDGMTGFTPDEKDEYEDDNDKSLVFDPLTDEKMDLMIDYRQFREQQRELEKKETKKKK